jgi:glutathione transport system permease protein
MPAGLSAQHPFGTDTIGHDMFAQVLTGTATSIMTAFVVAGVSTVFGTLIGATAGYYGKWADAALMRLTDLVIVVPLLAVLLVLANIFKTQADNWLFIALILAAVLWTFLARLVRGTFLSLREREFVEAEHAIGASDLQIIVRHCGRSLAPRRCCLTFRPAARSRPGARSPTSAAWTKSRRSAR